MPSQIHIIMIFILRLELLIKIIILSWYFKIIILLLQTRLRTNQGAYHCLSRQTDAYYYNFIVFVNVLHIALVFEKLPNNTEWQFSQDT